MVCMVCMFGIVCMVGVVIMFHMYSMCGMYDRYGMYGQTSYGTLKEYVCYVGRLKGSMYLVNVRLDLRNAANSK